MQFDPPSGELSVMITHGLEVLEWRMIRVDGDHLGSEVYGKRSDRRDEREGLFLHRGVVEFARSKLATEEADRVFGSINDLK